MSFHRTASNTLPFLLLVTLAACADELSDQEGVDPKGSSASEQQADESRLQRLDSIHDASVPCIAADAGRPGAGPLDGGSFDAGSPRIRDASTPPLAPSSAVGAHPGDFCSPVSGQRKFWAICETRRGLRCLPPRGANRDEPSTCACPPTASFERGVCNGEWDTPDMNDATAEPLGPSTAQGQRSGSQCAPGPFSEMPWALCDARRRLECRLPPVPPGLQDVVHVCLCPIGWSFVEGVCAPKPNPPPMQ